MADITLLIRADITDRSTLEAFAQALRLELERIHNDLTCLGTFVGTDTAGNRCSYRIPSFSVAIADYTLRGAE